MVDSTFVAPDDIDKFSYMYYNTNRIREGLSEGNKTNCARMRKKEVI